MTDFDFVTVIGIYARKNGQECLVLELKDGYRVALRPHIYDQEGKEIPRSAPPDWDFLPPLDWMRKLNLWESEHYQRYKDLLKKWDMEEQEKAAATATEQTEPLT